MSRIHEALKKAAQERSTQISAATVPEIATELGRSSFAHADVLQTPATDFHPPESTGLLRYEELTQRCARPAWHLDRRSNVFDGAAAHDAGPERFRTLRSRLYQIASTRPLHKVLVTSSIAAEGKTFVAANLAQSIVRQPDRRVLLIDADLRASRLHLTLGAPNSPGLTEYLLGKANELDIIQKGTEHNLCLIPGGQEVSNPSELLLSPRMKQLLDRVTPLFDWIIIDSPPALPVHDSSILADMCDGVLFVIRAGSTNVDLAEKAAAEFHEKNLLGVVLNRVERAESYGAYYYGGYPAVSIQ